MAPASAPTRKQHPVRIATAVLIPAALIGLVAGCGDSDDSTLTKAQVISLGGAICKQAESRVDDLPEVPGNPFGPGSTAKEHRQGRAFLRGYADALDYSRQGLSKLEAPDQDRDLLEGYLRDTGTVVDELRTAATAGRDRALVQAQRAFRLFEQASKQTAEYGFPKGVCGAGGSS